MNIFSTQRFITKYLTKTRIESILGSTPGGVSLGETNTTAYRGDRGKTAYDHSQEEHAPKEAQKNSNITKEEIEAKLTGEVSTHSHAGGGLSVQQIRNLNI